MKKLLALTLLLATSAAASPFATRLFNGPQKITVTWIAIGIGPICAILPYSLPGCGIGVPPSAWLKLTYFNGVLVSQELVH